MKSLGEWIHSSLHVSLSVSCMGLCPNLMKDNFPFLVFIYMIPSSAGRMLAETVRDES